MEERKGIFHFYSLRWYGKNIKTQKIIPKYSEYEIQELINALKKSKFYPNEKDENRYKIHNPIFIPKRNIIYWYFVKYYNEHIKTIENPDWKYVQTSEWYLFLYFLDDNRIVFQHKKWIWDKPWISQVLWNYIIYYINTLKLADLKRPDWWEKEELWRERKEFLEIFFDKNNKITYLELENFDKNLLLYQKSQNNISKYTYFNPKFDEWDTALQTEEKQIENLQYLKVEAKPGKSVSKVPACRIWMASSSSPKKMKFLREKSNIEEVFVEKWKSNIEEIIDSNTEINFVYIENIITTIYNTVKWKKALAKWEMQDWEWNQQKLF